MNYIYKYIYIYIYIFFFFGWGGGGGGGPGAVLWGQDLTNLLRGNPPPLPQSRVD